MGWFDDVTDFVEDAADVAADVATGDWGGAASTVFDGVEDLAGDTWLGDAAGWASGIAEDASWGSIASTVLSEVGGEVGGDFGGFLQDASGTVGNVMDGNWSDVLDTATDTFGDYLPADLGGLVKSVSDAADGDFDGLLGNATDFLGGQLGLDTGALSGAIGWAGQVAEGDYGGALGGIATTVLGGDAGGFVGGLTNNLMGGGLGEAGFGGLADFGLGQLEDLVPGAGDVVGGFLDGADPGSMLDSTLSGLGLPTSLGEVGAIAESVTGFDVSSLSGLGESLGLDLPDSLADLDSFVGSLGSGQAASVLEHLGAGGLDGFVESLGSQGASSLVNRFVEDGTFGDLLESAGAGTLQGLVGKLSDAGGLQDTLSQLDPTQTADLVQKLLDTSPAATAAAAVAAGVPTAVTDAVGDTADALGTAGVDALTGLDPIAATDTGMGLDSGMPDATLPDVGGDALGIGTDDLMAPLDTAADALAADPLADVMPDPVAVEPEPVVPDAIDTAVQTGDQVQESVDDMFDGLGS